MIVETPASPLFVIMDVHQEKDPKFVGSRGPSDREAPPEAALPVVRALARAGVPPGARRRLQRRRRRAAAAPGPAALPAGLPAHAHAAAPGRVSRLSPHPLTPSHPRTPAPSARSLSLVATQ